jgi:S1-C subfamily serine protease
LLLSTVLILTDRGHGSGFLIDAKRGIVVTNHHVIAGASDIDLVFPVRANGEVLLDRSAYLEFYDNDQHWIPAELVMDAPDKDLALLQVDRLPRSARPLRLARTPVSPPDKVYSLGNPKDEVWICTSGSVRHPVHMREFALGRGQQVSARAFVTDSPINPGDSGGPVVNEQCELVGIVCATMRGVNSIGEVISSEELATLLRQARIPVPE